MERTANENALQRAADLLRRAEHAVALTGAGSSTPSGIPDFRSPGSGLWEKADPMEVASIFALRRDPQAFYRWMQPLVEVMRNAQPNAGHYALARLEAAGRLKAIITQNIDGLHQRAGSQNVLEVHGHVRSATCLSCFRQGPIDDVTDVVARGQVPRCTACGGVLKPDVILFGEQLPSATLIAAMQHARRADLMLVVGSSLLVLPVAQMPAVTRSHGGEVIVINQQPTYADEFAAAVFHDDLADILPQLTERCLEEWT